MAWEVIALGLYEYRSGNFATAVEWTHRYSSLHENLPSRTAMAHCVLAMSYYRLNESEAAAAHLKQARELIDPRFEPIFQVDNSTGGIWYDWLLDRQLLREAIVLIEPQK